MVIFLRKISFCSVFISPNVVLSWKLMRLVEISAERMSTRLSVHSVLENTTQDDRLETAGRFLEEFDVTRRYRLRHSFRERENERENERETERGRERE